MARPATEAAQLAVVLHDLAWLLPRTVGSDAARRDPLPSSELEIMRLLTRRPRLTVNEVASALGLQSTNVSTGIRSLVGKGLLARAADPADGRIVRLEPTATAMKSRHAREQSWGVSLGSVLEGMDAAQVADLVAALPALEQLAARLTGRDAATTERATAEPATADAAIPE